MKAAAVLLAIVVSVLLLAPAPAFADWASEIAASNPLNWWRFDEASGTTVADSGSGGLAGTLVNGATLGHTGPLGGALHLDGATNAHVLLAGTALPAPWTLEAVFYQDDTTAGPSSALIGPELFGSPNTAIKAEQWNETGQLGYTAFGVVDETFDDPAAATPTSYAHVAFVGTAGGVSVYVNGALADTEDTPIDLHRGIVGLSGLSGEGAPIDALGGFIDELVIYDRELSAAEIGAHAAVVPEPATIALLVVALLGVVVVRKPR